MAGTGPTGGSSTRVVIPPQTPIATPTPAPTAAPGGTPTLNVNALLAGIGTKSTTGGTSKALAWDGTKQVPTTDLKKQWLNLSPDFKKYIIDYAAQQGIPPKAAQTVYNKLVDASQASVQAGKPLSPMQVLQNAIKTNIPVSQGLPSSVRATSYNDTEANALVRAAYTKIFNRVPTDLDLNSPANVTDPTTGEIMKDPKSGQPLTWAQALQNVSSNPDFQESIDYTVDGQGNVKTITTKPAVDPNTWLETAMTKAYSSAIKSGELPPEAQMEQQYAQLAAEYGKNAYDPATKQLTPLAQVDLSNLEAGTSTLDQLKKNWSDLAVPNIAAAAAPGLQSGAATLKGFAQPAISRVAQLLEKDPATVTVNDPYVQKYLRGDGKNFMSPAELDATIKQDPNWQYTQNAHATYSDLASSILSKMGFNA